MAETDQISGAAIPKELRPFVEVLGLGRAVDLVLKVGGSRIFIPKEGVEGSALAGIVGIETAGALAEAMGGDRVYVPLCKDFLIRYLRARRYTIGQIARKLRCGETQVYRAFRQRAAKPRRRSAGV